MTYHHSQDDKLAETCAAAVKVAFADCLIGEAIARGADLYDRARDLPKLFPASRLEGKSDGEIVDMLRRHASAGQKALARGAWHADSDRVMALRQALRGEELRR